MKKIILGLALSVASTGVFSQTEPTDQLGQQLSVSQDVIRNLVNDLSSRAGSSNLTVRDYRSWKKVFDATTEEAFTKYEDKIATNVYGPLKEVVSKYNSILRNESIEIKQKENLLNSVLDQIQSLIPHVKKEYHKALRNLYMANNLLPVAINTDEKRVSRRRAIHITPAFSLNNGQAISAKAHLTFRFETRYCIYSVDPIIEKGQVVFGKGVISNARHEFCDDHRNNDQMLELREKFENPDMTIPYVLLERFSYDFTHQRIINGCESKGCILLKTSDLSFYFDAIYQMLDKDIIIELKTVDNKNRKVVLEALRLPSINYWKKLINRGDFPESVEKLPFDI